MPDSRTSGCAVRRPKELTAAKRPQKLADLPCASVEWLGYPGVAALPCDYAPFLQNFAKAEGALMNVLEHIETQRDEYLNELKEFLRIPSVSTQMEHKQDIERAAHWVADKLHAAGLDKVEIVPTKMHPMVYGESLHATGKPTVLFYGHYDVQPPEPLDLWTSPAFEPTVRDGNLFGRGTADDKGQVHIHLAALESLMKTAGKLPINIKVLIEGEEEVGSANLWDFVQANKARLKADALIVSDTSMLGPGVPSVTYALRGLVYYQVEITGPAQDLHSGVFGG